MAVFMLGGAVIMLGCLLWVSQFFNLDDDTTPVIWIEDLQNPRSPQQEESFAEWQE